MKKLILVSLVSLLCSCSNTGKAKIDDKVITVGASSTPHARILEQAKSYVESKGYSLDIKVMTDYVTPNISLNDGDLDANYFQHEPYLKEFNESHGTKLVSVEKIHFEPMTVFVGKSGNGKIIIPNDKSNSDRARALLNKLYMYESIYTYVEAEASTIPMLLSDCAYAVVNGNYALGAGLFETGTVYGSESKDDEVAKTMANIIAVKKGNEEKPAIKVLCESLKQDNIKEFINTEFKGAVVPMF